MQSKVKCLTNSITAQYQCCHNVEKHLKCWLLHVESKEVHTIYRSCLTSNEFPIIMFVLNQSQIILRINVLHHHFSLPEVNIHVQNDYKVLERLALCLKYMKLAMELSSHGHFEQI